MMAWQFWNTPSSQVKLLRRLQTRWRGESGGRLWRDAEVDHRIPLFRVWMNTATPTGPTLLGFWGLPKLRVISREVHIAKCASETPDRSAARLRASDLP
jgi:hypothetical protein